MRLLCCRISSGANRDPGRYELPPSKGMPSKATSSPATSRVWGNRMNVASCAKRGERKESAGRNSDMRILRGDTRGLRQARRRSLRLYLPVLIDERRHVRQQHRSFVVHVKTAICAVPSHHGNHVVAVAAFDKGDIIARPSDRTALRGHRDHWFHPGLQVAVVVGDLASDV